MSKALIAWSSGKDSAWALHEVRRAGEHDCGLTGIVEDEGREDDQAPREADRRRAEMAHVGVERLGPGHAKEHPAEHQKTLQAPV